MKLLLLYLSVILLPLVASSDKDLSSPTSKATTASSPTSKATTASSSTHKALEVSSSTSKAPEAVNCYCNAGPDCKDNVCKLQEGGTCIAVAAKTNIENSTAPEQMYKGCLAASDSCKKGAAAIYTGEGAYWISNTTCCSTHKCNDVPFQVPKENMKISTLECSSCFAINSSSCNSTTMNCTMSEKQCLSVTGVFTKSNRNTTFVLKGCATSEDEIFKSGIPLVFNGSIYYFNSANRSPGSIAFAVLLPGLVGFLLEKFLF